MNELEVNAPVGNAAGDANQASTPEQLQALALVLNRTTIGRSTWYKGLKSGSYPAPVRVSARRVAWRKSDIDRLIETLAATK